MLVDESTDLKFSHSLVVPGTLVQMSVQAWVKAYSGQPRDTIVNFAFQLKVTDFYVTILIIH